MEKVIQKQPPKARSQLAITLDPLVMEFGREDWAYKNSLKKNSTSKYASRIYHPKFGYIAIDWRKSDYLVCDGVQTKIIDSNSENNSYIKGDFEKHALIIDASACPVFVEIAEFTSTCSRDGDPDHWSDDYWVEVVKT